MSDEPGGVVDYLDEEDAFEAVEELGFHIKDAGLLSSAIARPQASVFGQDAYPDLVTKAAALFESLVRNHPLHDGNKRLSVVLTWAFMHNNGMRLEHSKREAYDFALAAAAGELTFEEIRAWCAAHAQPDRAGGPE